MRIWIVVLLIIPIFQQPCTAQSKLDRFRARTDRQIRLRNTGAKPVSNPEGLKLPANKDTERDELIRISKSNAGYVPWINILEAKPDQVGRLYHHGIPDGNYITKVSQVIDSKNLLTKDYWVSGIDTTSLADGSDVLIDQVMHHIGTKQYSTVSGSARTVPHYSTESEIAKTVQAISDELNASPPKQDYTVYRRWTAKDKTRLTGAFAGSKSGKVTLDRPDGSQIEVKLKDLSSADKKLAVKARKHLKNASK